MISNYRKYTAINKTMQKKQQNESLGKHVYSNLPPIQQTNRGYAQPPHTLRDSTQQDRQQRGTHNNNTDR